MSEVSKVEATLDLTSQRLAGTLLSMGGILFFIAGALHPGGHEGQDFKMAIVSMLSDKMWPIAHYCALISAFIIAWSLSILLDKTKGIVTNAIRLGVISSIFMTMEFSVELAAPSEVSKVATDGTSPFLSLIDVMQAVGWPFFAVTFILLIINSDWTPIWVRVLGVIGSCALAIGGFVVQGLHMVAIGPVFILGNALPIWMVWAGIKIRATATKEAHSRKHTG